MITPFDKKMTTTGFAAQSGLDPDTPAPQDGTAHGDRAQIAYTGKTCSLPATLEDTPAARMFNPIGGTMNSPCILPLLIACLATQTAQADPLYKWRDSAGHVTYSSTPPPAGARAKTMKAPPPPTEEETRQAQQRVRRTQEQAREMEDRRRKREAEDARLRALQPPPPVVIEQPVYVPQPIYYPPARARPRPHHNKHPRPRTR